MKKGSMYPEEVQVFIYEHSNEYSRQELSEELKSRFGFEKSPDALHSWCSARKLHFKPRKGRKCPELSKYPEEMHGYIREIAYGRSYKEITQMINDRFGEGTITTKQIHSYLKNHKIKTGRTGCYAKGHVPWTKGRKIEEIIKDPEKRQGFYDSQYKKGNVPHNTLPVGSIVKTTDGYLARKKQMEGSQRDKWEFLHRAVWEEHNGPIPDGMKISFKDGNKENCDIENLMIVTKGEHVLLTTLKLRSEDPDLTEAGLQVVRIIQQCKELEKARK